MMSTTDSRIIAKKRRYIEILLKIDVCSACGLLWNFARRRCRQEEIKKGRFLKQIDSWLIFFTLGSLLPLHASIQSINPSKPVACLVHRPNASQIEKEFKGFLFYKNKHRRGSWLRENERSRFLIFFVIIIAIQRSSIEIIAVNW